MKLSERQRAELEKLNIEYSAPIYIHDETGETITESYIHLANVWGDPIRAVDLKYIGGDFSAEDCKYQTIEYLIPEQCKSYTYKECYSTEPLTLNINCTGSLTDLKIDKFINLDCIEVDETDIVEIKITDCNELTQINLTEGFTDKLTISQCNNLEMINLEHYSVNELIVRDCPHLETIWLGEKDIDKITIENCKELERIIFSVIKVSNIKLHNCKKLRTVNFLLSRGGNLSLNDVPNLVTSIGVSNDN